MNDLAEQPIEAEVVECTREGCRRPTIVKKGFGANAVCIPCKGEADWQEKLEQWRIAWMKNRRTPETS